jgi:DNA helicase-2/ATP-dependent DNA helicase PcrA
MSGKAGSSLAAFAALIARLAQAAHLPLPELVEHVVELSGLRAHYQAEKEGQDRLANLEELVNAAANFVAEEGRVGGDDEDTGELRADLIAFLTHAALEAGEHQAGEGDDALQLMTVHSAKGLEFNVVFITGLEEGLFPHENSAQEPGGLEEERRLMYVAVTRARRRLYLSHAQTRMLHGQTRYNLPSRFLEEIPAGLLKWLTPKATRGGFAMDREPSYAPSPRGHSGAGGGFRIGQSVRHAKFGEGVIENLEGGGRDARARINFGAAGVKWLDLGVAKLEPA